MKLRRRNLRKPARIEMVPLIDIVFLLLVFFIYAMLTMAVHKGMNVDLPESAQSVMSPDADISVSVTLDRGQPLVFLDKEQVSLKELRKRLINRIGEREGNGPEVLLFADRSVSYQQLYTVLDTISSAGVRAISLQAEQKRK